MMSSRILEGHSLILGSLLAKRHHHVGRVVRTTPPFAFNKVAKSKDISPLIPDYLCILLAKTKATIKHRSHNNPRNITMSPTESQSTMPAIMVNGQALPSPPERVQTVQPRVAEPMSTC